MKYYSVLLLFSVQTFAVIGCGPKFLEQDAHLISALQENVGNKLQVSTKATPTNRRENLHKRSRKDFEQERAEEINCMTRKVVGIVKILSKL